MLRTQCRILHGTRQGQCRAFTSSAPSRIALGSTIELTADLIRSIHDLSGLTYGFSIPLTAIALRTVVTLPLAIYSQKKLNRRLELRPLFYHWGEVIGSQAVARQKALNVDLRRDKEALEKTALNVRRNVYHRMKLLYKRHGCTKVRIILPTLVQVPLFLLVSLALRAMSGWSGWFDVGMWASLEPLFHTEGFGTIQNLTQPDQSFILPVMIGLIGISNIEMTAARRSITMSNEQRGARLRNITRVSLLMLSTLMIPVAMQAPAAISLYWATSASYSLLQNLLMQKFYPTRPPYAHRQMLGPRVD